MKNLITVFVIFLFFTSCEKTEDDTENDCTSNCTTLSGKFVTLNNVPVSNIKVSLKYRISGGELGGGSTRKIVSTQSDQSGNFYKNFFIKDNELGHTANGYFEVEIDDSNIDVNKYIRTNNLIGNTSTDIGFAIYSITNRDTIIDKIFYIPKKTYIKVNLNNFLPLQADDYFEVQTLYPFGPKIGVNTFLNSEYSTGFSGYGNWRATNLNNLLNVFVAEGENNVIRIFRRKNGVNTSVDFPIFIPPNNTIELTYNF
ncbi:hypothetical protein [Flavobacterium sp.]|uniref:hypothetical protein n=1 Tax=Flavobacterium sp. TaxID=239 RepID=UPI00286DF06A|nr:hypothetical protein [Flavobacterium sp.]